MAKVTINESTLTGIGNAIRAKTGGFALIDPADMADEIEAIPSGATLITKSITANGTYSASSDNADGYSSVTVDVPSVDPNDTINKLISGTLTYFKSNSSGNPPTAHPSLNQSNYVMTRYFSMKNLVGNIYDYTFGYFGRTSDNAYDFRKTIILGSPSFMQNYIFYNTILYTLVLLNASSVPQLSGALAGVNVNNLVIWVRDSMLSSFKSASNWSNYGDKYKGFSEAPTYDNSITYGIGDVCQYSGRFYSYCKSDWTSSAGHAPSGTTDDNDYWEYLAEVNS